MVPRDGRGRPRQETPRHHVDRLDRQTVARERVQAIDRRRRLARQAEESMPLVLWYGPRPLRVLPLGQVLAEPWWWAA